MVVCKKCGCEKCVKNGFVRGQQRYRCKECECNFIEGDRRAKASTNVKKALCVLLYALSKASFNMMGKLLGHSPSLIYRWIRQAMDKTEEPLIEPNIEEIAFDEMWHFLESKKRNYGSLKPWTVARGELLPGLQVIVMLQPFKDSTIKSST